jgi:hypothetical protein
LFVLTHSSTEAVTYGAVTANNEFRAFVIDQDTNRNYYAVGGLKYEVTATGNHTGTAQLDAGGFKIEAGPSAAYLNNPSFYFGGLSITGQASWSQNKSVVSVSAAWAEVAVGITGIFLYDNRDGQPGFQYKIGNMYAFSCLLAPADVDCIFDTSNIRLKEDVYWSAWARSTSPCPAGSGYSTDCLIYTFATTGTLIADGAQVAVLTLRLSNQPVLANQDGNTHEIGPDRAKLDVQITYPYTSRPLIVNPNAKVGLSAAAAGKAGSFSAVAASIDGKNALVWNGDNDRASYFSYDGTATIGSGASTVYVSAISGAEIENTDCSGCDFITKALVDGLKWVVGVWKSFGWTTELYFFSWDVSRPTTILYDPSFGMTGAVTSSAFYAVPPIWSLFLCLFVYLFSK